MRLLVLPGDGIGPEIVQAAVSVLQSAREKLSLDLSLSYDDVGFASLKKHGTTLRDEVLDNARSFDGIVLGTQAFAEKVAQAV